ncbi:hypothetical protein FAGKG844_380033 [Frankia sp. AgKG'84/4]
MFSRGRVAQPGPAIPAAFAAARDRACHPGTPSDPVRGDVCPAQDRTRLWGPVAAPLAGAAERP